ncbi:MAG: GntR family transcriptional regulator [Frondihabitans sp.]|nr:GntR family transcriptional regulator [Frondihabitans sp.]
MTIASAFDDPQSGPEISRVPASVAEALRVDVLAVRIRPGEAVTEAGVAARFGISRPTARIAIDQLVRAGLLRREANRGARVPTLSRDDIVDLYDNRALIEGAALAALAERGSVPADAVRHNRALAAAPDDAPFATDDIAFHRALVSAQSSPRLTRMHESLMGEIALCIGQVEANALLRPADIAEQHAHVLEAVIDGDPSRASRLVREHIEFARDRLLEHADGHRRSSEPRPAASTDPTRPDSISQEAPQ